MPARTFDHRRAAARVAILERWREPNDPELVSAQWALTVARAEARLAEATAALASAGTLLRVIASGVAR